MATISLRVLGETSSPYRLIDVMDHAANNNI